MFSHQAGFAEKEKEIISLKSEIMALNQENNALRLVAPIKFHTWKTAMSKIN